MRLNLFLGGILLTVALVACKKDEAAPNFHYNYFPLEEGRFVTYSVREVTIDDQVLQNDTAFYYIKAQIGDTITDNEGRVARRYNRYYSASPNGPWVLEDIWTTLIDGGRAELMEENQRTIKMVFAPTKYKEWDCNAYNVSDELDCYYRDIHLPSSINGFSFDSTVTVEQEEYKTAVDYRRKYEQYAKGVGMIYKHYKDYRIFFDTNDVVSGKEIVMKLVDYGVE